MDRFSYWLERSSLYIALLAAWIAMCGSLYFSEVAGYIPCTFCWYQRILMYPLTIIIPVGILRRDRHLPLYVLPLSVVGIGVSTYHYLLQKTDLFSELSTCQVGVPCSGIWINWFGFITIPFLALIAFFIITVMSIIAWQAGEPGDEVEDETATAAPAWQTWVPIVTIIAVVVIVFVTLGQLASSTAVEHTAVDFPIVETGAITLLDGQQVDTSAIYEEGRRLYGQSCAACHGLEGEGVTGIGSALTTSPLVIQSTERELIAYIRKGLEANDPHNESGIPMPASGGQPTLTDEQLLAIIRYLRAGV
jgi:disulfide bond formation protein DsbB